MKPSVSSRVSRFLIVFWAIKIHERVSIGGACVVNWVPPHQHDLLEYVIDRFAPGELRRGWTDGGGWLVASDVTFIARCFPVSVVFPGLAPVWGWNWGNHVGRQWLACCAAIYRAVRAVGAGGAVVNIMDLAWVAAVYVKAPGGLYVRPEI